jgi:hypothetical protein
MYYVSLCKDGVWRYVIVDDFLPIRVNKKKHLLFIHTTNQYEHEYEVWAAIIEKAVAKIYGTYEDIVLTKSDGIKRIFKMLTGYPSSEYDTKETSLKSFSIILESSLKQKHIVVLEKLATDQEKLRGLNLINSYSYQVVGMNGNYLTLRNYSEEEPDRSYSMDELSVFGRLLIFKHEDNYIFVSRTLRHQIGYHSEMSFKVPKDTNCYFEVWQLNPVYFRCHSGASEKEYSTGPYMIEIKNISPNNIDEVRLKICRLYIYASQDKRYICMPVLTQCECTSVSNKSSILQFLTMDSAKSKPKG